MHRTVVVVRVQTDKASFRGRSGTSEVGDGREYVELPGVERRIDHLAVDPAGKRLFVAALGNGTLKVLDVDAGKRITSIGGLKEPRGVAYLPLLHRIVVATR
jgi:YVTN family beta-propeller protein